MSTQLDSTVTGTRKEESSPPSWIITNTSRYSSAFFSLTHFQATKFPFLSCQRGQGTFGTSLSSRELSYKHTHVQTHRPLLSFKSTKGVSVCMCDSWFTLKHKGAVREKSAASPGWTGATAAFFCSRLVKTGPCGSAESPRMWLLIRRRQGWARSFDPGLKRKSDFPAQWVTDEGKRLGLGKARPKGLCECKRGRRTRRGGGHGTMHSHFSTPLFEPPNPKSFLSWQLPARKLFSQRDEGCKGLRLVCRLSGDFTGSTVPETEGDRFSGQAGNNGGDMA